MENNQLVPQNYFESKSADQFGMPVTKMDSVRATFDLAFLDKTTDQLADLAASKFFNAFGEDTTPLMSPEELNAEFGMDVDTPFKDPMHRGSALQVVQKIRERKKFEEIIAQGGGGGLGISLLAGLAASVTDPTDLLVGVVSGAALGSAFKGLAATRFAPQAAKVAAVTGFAGQRTAATVLKQGLTEGLAEGVLTESLIYRPEAARLHQDRSWSESAMNVLASSAAFPAARFGFDFVSTRGMEFINRLDTRSAGLFFRSAIYQFKNKGKVGLDKLEARFVRETSDANLKDGQPPFMGTERYAYAKVAPEQVSQKRFFLSSSKKVSNLADLDSFGIVSEDYGGIELSDNAYAKVASEARDSFNELGVVYEVKPKKILADNLIDLTVGLKEIDLNNLTKLQAAVDNTLGKNILDIAKIAQENPNARGTDLLEALHDGTLVGDYKKDTLNRFRESLKEQGVRGYLHDGAKSAGRDHSLHNVINAFYKEDLELINSQEAVRGYSPDMSKEEATEIYEEITGPAKLDADEQLRIEKTSQELKNITNHEDLVNKTIDDSVEEIDAYVQEAYARGELTDADLEADNVFKQEKEALYKGFKEYVRCLNG